MSNALQDYLLNQAPQVVEASLKGVVGKAASYVTNEAQYRQGVIRKGWEALPVAIRMLFGKQYARWDTLYLALRNQVFDLGRGTVALRPDASARVAAAVKSFFGAPAFAPEPPPEQPPLATPVGPSPSVPLARPVEPAAKDAARPSGAAVGIDLGTTFSLVAHVDAQGRPACIPNSAGDLLTPSIVLFDEGGAVVGKEAVLASAMEPDKVAECVKRDMGAKAYRKKINGEDLPPEVISSMILRSLKADAERRLGPVKKAVITVPAYFDDTRRRATMDAGRLAGLEVLDIINEPTAAAVAYGYQLGFLDAGGLRDDRPLRVLVYDLGGGTFDVTLLEIRGKLFKALATDGDVGLGGKDWDDRLVELAAGRFREQFHDDPREDPVSLQELRLAAEAAKRTLTERPKAALFINHHGSRLKVEVTRQEFEDASRPLLDRTRMTVEIVLRHAGMTWADVDRVLLVGGSTRMPMVGRMLQELSGKPPDRSINPDEAVAHGAALFAALLAAKVRGPEGAHEQAPVNAPFEVENVNSHSLGILGKDVKSGRKVNRVLIPRNSPLPRTVSKVFRTFRPNQRSVEVRVLEGESERPEVCTQVGVCAIRDLPPNLPVGWPVRVSYSYEANGRLHVTARVKGHSQGVVTDFLCENRMPDEDLDLWIHYVDEEFRES